MMTESSQRSRSGKLKPKEERPLVEHVERRTALTGRTASPSDDLDAGVNSLRPGNEGIYRGDIIVGALLLPETRLLADLMLRGVSEDEWRTAVWPDNILRARQRKRAVRVASLIRARLETVTPDVLELIRDGAGVIAVQATLAAAVKHSRLLGDFMRLVVAEQYRRFEPRLTKKTWDDYVDECHERDAHMPIWNQATRDRLRSSVFQTLAQAGYVQDTRSLRLQAVHVAERVAASLRASNDIYVLQCLEVSP